MPQPLCGADWKAAVHGEEVGISVRRVVVVEEALVLHISVCECNDAEGWIVVQVCCCLQGW